MGVKMPTILKNKIPFFLIKMSHYLKFRVAPISLLWAGAGLALASFNTFLGSMSENSEVKVKVLNIASLVDYRLLIVLFFGMLVIISLVLICVINLRPDATDRARAWKGLFRCLDEISAASTHAAAMLITSIAIQEIGNWPAGFEKWDRVLIISLYFLFGVLTYNGEDSVGLLAGVNSQSPTARQAAPPAPAPVLASAPSPAPVSAAPSSLASPHSAANPGAGGGVNPPPPPTVQTPTP
ncbi:hypothetical protein OX462_12280 [Janthinobacterium sp. SUN098]|uniref:hypothetical protein n=1 Tax=Janthinobacterium sp. SUN098 TaxID=3002437 RepID=UPI0038D42766